MKKILSVLVLYFGIADAAVNLHPGGLGEVLLVPYYTVNNDLNTLVTVSNTTDQSKAVKIIFRETTYGFHRDSLNVYLAPNDSWAFALAKDGGLVKIFSQDLSCVPRFESPRRLSDGLADPQPPGGLGFSEGIIEIYEMGELDPSFGYGEAVTFSEGQPRDCALIEASWLPTAVSDWFNNQGLTEMLPASGGLMAAVSFVNVTSGINFSYSATAINEFYPEDSLIHSRPSSYRSPSLHDADDISSVPYHGASIVTQWPNGFEAVSAVLMKQQLYMDYSNELNINAQTEVILSMPTRDYHGIRSGSYPPFNQDETLFSDCELYQSEILDRDGQSTYYVSGSVSPLPPILCDDVNVIKIWDFYSTESTYYPILDSVNRFNQSIFEGSEGLYKIKFNQFTANGQSLDGSETHTYHGLPMIGIYLSSYTNANAQPGLLAQYGGAFVVKSKQKIERSSVAE